MDGYKRLIEQVVEAAEKQRNLPRDTSDELLNAKRDLDYARMTAIARLGVEQIMLWDLIESHKLGG